MHWPFPSRPVRPLLCLSVPETEEGTRIQVSKTRSKCPPDHILSFFSRWVRETEVAGPSKPLRGGGGVGWGGASRKHKARWFSQAGCGGWGGGVGARPPSPASPRASHDIRCRGVRRAQARAKEAGGRGRVALLGRALLRPARSLRPAPPVPSCPRRASGVHNATVARAASAALGCAAHPASSLSAVAAVGHAAAGRGRAAAGESGARAANPSPSGSRTARRLPSPSYSPLPAPSRFLLLLLFGPQLPAPCPQGEILGTRCENSSWCSWGSRAVSTRFILSARSRVLSPCRPFSHPTGDPPSPGSPRPFHARAEEERDADGEVGPARVGPGWGGPGVKDGGGSGVRG